MSCWSYITGWVQVQPLGRTQEEIEYILKTVLNHLPVVQGSEEDMYVHIIKASGYNMSLADDEYGNITNNLKDCGYGEPYSSRNGYALICYYDDIDSIRSVVNLVTKEKYYHKPTYQNLKESLVEMKCLYFVNFGKHASKIAMPKIGCGLDRLKWNDVEQIIKDVFADTDVEILVCDWK